MSKLCDPKISVCIATYNMKQYLAQAVSSILCQGMDRDQLEIIIYDDHSTDGTELIQWIHQIHNLRYIRGSKNLGVGAGFNQAIKAAKGEIVVLMCADDLICDPNYFKDLIRAFEDPTIGHVTRFYYQFIHGQNESIAVRAWRSRCPIIQANNPSGLAFRRIAMTGCECSNKMFIETSQLASQVIAKGWDWRIVTYDAIAVRVHNSTSTRRDYWLKRRVSSPLKDWLEIGGKDIAKDYVSLIQIKNGFTIGAVLEEIGAFLKYRKANWISPRFWFFAAVAVLTPRWILRKIPDLYRKTWGRLTTGRIYRERQTY